MNIEELSKLIDMSMKVINTLPEESIRRSYNTEIIEEYNNEVTLLKQALEEYFIKEQKEGTPSNLSLRRAYQNLRYL